MFAANRLYTRYHLLALAIVGIVSCAFALACSCWLTASADAQTAQSVENAKALIADLKADPGSITEKDRADIEAATAAYDALTAEEQTQLDTELYVNAKTYGSILESSQWALASLETVDNSTKLADGDYSKHARYTFISAKDASQTDNPWMVDKLVVESGKTTIVVHPASASEYRTLSMGNILYAATVKDGIPLFEIPVSLDEDLYFTASADQAASSTVQRLVVSLDDDTRALTTSASSIAVGSSSKTALKAASTTKPADTSSSSKSSGTALTATSTSSSKSSTRSRRVHLPGASESDDSEDEEIIDEEEEDIDEDEEEEEEDTSTRSTSVKNAAETGDSSLLWLFATAGALSLAAAFFVGRQLVSGGSHSSSRQ